MDPHLFLFQIGEFYSKDSFGLELALEFWCPTESLQHTSLQGSYLGMALQRPPHKQVETHIFWSWVIQEITFLLVDRFKGNKYCLILYVSQFFLFML